MPVNISYILEQFSDFKEGDNIKCTTQTFKNIINEKSNFKNKRTKCSYFVWLEENRSEIRSKYFSDFEDVSNWCMENKKEYYLSKGLPIEKIVKEGKPRIVSLITTKAGIIWKSLSTDERSIYEQKAQILKENSRPVVIEQKPKKKRGRPKKKNSSNTIVEAVVEQFKENEEQEDTSNILKVQEIKHLGKTYYLDVNTNDIYDPISSDLVGKKDNNQINIYSN
jgi:hypothetical protein